MAVVFAMHSRRDGIMPVLSDMACSDHSGRNRPWDFLFESRFYGNDFRRPTRICEISSDLAEIGPRHPCSSSCLRSMPAWFGHSRVVCEDFKTYPIDWSSQKFRISPAHPHYRASHNPVRSAEMCSDPSTFAPGFHIYIPSNTQWNLNRTICVE